MKTRKVLSPAKKGKLSAASVRKAVKAVISRRSKAECLAAGKDITQEFTNENTK